MENNFNSLYPEGSGKMVEEGVIQDVSCKVVSSKHERDTCALEISTTWWPKQELYNDITGC